MTFRTPRFDLHLFSLEPPDILACFAEAMGARRQEAFDVGCVYLNDEILIDSRRQWPLPVVGRAFEGVLYAISGANTGKILSRAWPAISSSDGLSRDEPAFDEADISSSPPSP